MVAVWAEADLALADEFRDGNVPARRAPVTCAKMAFAALPTDIQARYFRGDSACHDNDLIHWLVHPDRATEPGGAIGFAISAMMSEELMRTIKRIPHKDWTTFDTEADGTLRQWAEVPFVRSERYEQKDRLLMVHLAGRMNRNNCVMGLRLCAPVAAIARMKRVWDVFALPTQATHAVAMGRPGT